MTTRPWTASVLVLLITCLPCAAQEDQITETRSRLFAELRLRLEGTRWLVSWGGARKEPSDVVLISVDPSRYKVITRGFRAFVRLDYSVPHTSPLNTAYDETVFYEDLNCRDLAFRVVSQVDYDSGSGRDVYTARPERAKWVVALPETQDEVMLRSACTTLSSLQPARSPRKRRTQ